MKYLLSLLLSFSISYASFDNINSFEADFTQTVTNDKDNSLVYKGSIVASKPQNALWVYKKPIQKEVYISKLNVTVVEPEIEQVIIRSIDSNLDFFNMIKNAKKIKENVYEAIYGDSKFIITTNNTIIKSISYVDEFENKINIIFENQKQNKEIDMEIFTPKYPLEFDIIRD